MQRRRGRARRLEISDSSYTGSHGAARWGCGRQRSTEPWPSCCWHMSNPSYLRGRRVTSSRLVLGKLARPAQNNKRTGDAALSVWQSTGLACAAALGPSPSTIHTKKEESGNLEFHRSVLKLKMVALETPNVICLQHGFGCTIANA
jgi:hypothetical protein